MTTTKNKTTYKINLESINEIIKDAIKPDTIYNIHKKLGLSFPFTVKRIKCSGHGRGGFGKGSIITITGYKSVKISSTENDIVIKETGTINAKGYTSYLSATRFKDFVIWE